MLSLSPQRCSLAGLSVFWQLAAYPTYLVSSGYGVFFQPLWRRRRHSIIMSFLFMSLIFWPRDTLTMVDTSKDDNLGVKPKPQMAYQLDSNQSSVYTPG
jgi:hypothetical protein